MINYSINKDIRKKVVLFFALSSVGLYILLTKYINPNLLVTMIVTMFSIIFWLFDKYIWKINFFYKFLSVPNFNGTWGGTINSSEMDNPKKVNVYITQTWSQISIILEDKDTYVRSISDSANITINDKNLILLSYSYDFQNSKGFSELRYDNNLKKDKLIGSYFTSLPSNGVVNLVKVYK